MSIHHSHHPGGGEIRFGTGVHWHSRLQAIGRRHVNPEYRPHRDDEPDPVVTPQPPQRQSLGAPGRVTHRPQHWLDQQAEALEALVREGRRLSEIAEIFDTSSSFVFKVLNRLGLASHLHPYQFGRPSKKAIVREALPRIEKMRTEGVSAPDIAVALGMGYSTLNRHLQSLHHPRPHQS